MWRNTIDKHELELCETRCYDVGLLPREGTDTVLGRAASTARARIEHARCSYRTITKEAVEGHATPDGGCLPPALSDVFPLHIPHLPHAQLVLSIAAGELLGAA